jgi:UDP-N-acetylglucosamine 2-epimerase (non-hydrolysing)
MKKEKIMDLISIIKKIYGKPGEVSKKIVKILKKEFKNDENNFFPWLHQRFNYWNEDDKFEYL